MIDHPSQMVVMVDGDLPSVVAAANAKEAMLSAGIGAGAGKGGPLLWPAVDGSNPARLAACVRLSAVLGLTLIERRSVSVGPQGGEWSSPSRVLIDACTDAATHGRTEVVWPVQFTAGGRGTGGLDLDLVSRASDRALLVTRLMTLDAGAHGVPALHVETPFVDLTDRQVADLALDLAAPVACCWWWEGAESGDEAGALRARWTAALRAAGFGAAGFGAGNLVR